MNYLNNILFYKKSKTKFIIKKIFLNYFVSLCVFVVLLVILANPKTYGDSIINGFMLFANCVFPGLFPFLVFTKILTDLGAVTKISNFFAPLIHKVFNVNGISAYVFIMSAMCGYPMGAKLIADLRSKDLISELDAEKMLCFCSVSGPIFIIGTIGSAMFGNVLYGIIIFLSHIIASLLMGSILIKIKFKHTESNAPTHLMISNKMNVNYDSILGESVYSATTTIIMVGAFVTLFSLIIDILNTTNILAPIIALLKIIFKFININPELATGTIFGLIEITRGIKILSSFGATKIVLSLCCLLVSFSGFSIIMQCKTLLKKTNIQTSNYIKIKILHALFSFFICIIICYIFKI